MFVFRRSLVFVISIAILLSGLVLSGCYGGGFAPHGWAGPVVADDTLYAASLDGDFLAIDLSNRSIRDFTPREKEKPSTLFGCPGVSPPVVLAYATPLVSSGTEVYVASYDGTVYALDKFQGGEMWRKEFKHRIVADLAMSNDALIVASGDKLYALNVATAGEEIWDKPFKADGEIFSGPVVFENNIYFGSMGHSLYAIDLATGHEVWEREFKGPIASTPAIDTNGILYVGTFESKFYAIDTATGQDVWNEPFEAGDWFWNRAVLSEGIVFVGTFDGVVHAIDAETGKRVWDYQTPAQDRIRAAPVVVGKTLVVGSQDDSIYGLNVETGKQAWAPIHLGDDILADPTVDGNMVYFITQDNKLHALNAETGIKDWSISLGLESEE